ncbi:CNH domain-containing protein [Chytriomyces sp. MP71]|nr:CNH domain-containing protein [Chytriomyces sp. MP71]
MDVVLVQCLIESLPFQIGAFAAYDNRLLIATSSQSLLLYTITETPQFEITLADSRKGFARKGGIKAMGVVEEASLLLLLEDSQIRTVELATFATRETLNATQGATLLAISSKASNENADVTSTSSIYTDEHLNAPNVVSSRLIAVVVKKRILIYKSSLDGTLRLIKELATPDRAHTLTWLNSNTLAYAHPKRGYFTVTIDTNTVTELYKFNASYFPGGSVSKVGIAELPKGQLLLTRNNGGVFVNADASPLIERDLEWSGTPDAITYSAPYVVAMISGFIEVRSLTTGGVVQRIDFPGAQRMQMGSGTASLIHISSLNCIWRLLPVSFEDQIEHLIASNQFIEAQRLIEELEFSSEEEKVSNIIRVRGLYAHHMFTMEHKYEAAMSLLSELRASPIDIVNLFPQFSLMGPSSDPPVTDTVALLALKDYLISQRHILAKLRRLHQNPNHLPLNQIPTPAPSTPKTGTTAATIAAASSLFSGSDHGVPDAVEIPDAVLRNADDALFLSSVVDTTLLKVYLIVNEGLVGSLVRVENYCDLEETEAALKAKNKEKELIDFYYSKGQHRKALENLHHPNDIMQYLQKLNIVAHVDLFLEFSGPIFDMDVNEGLAIFTERYEDVPLRTHLKIIDFFEHKSAALETQYLEHMIENLHSDHPEFHDRVVLLYLQALVEYITASEVLEGFEGVFENGGVSDFQMMRRKLVLFLESSKFYRPEKLVSLFPDDVLLEEKVIILGKLKHHKDALTICIQKLMSLHLAKRYCEIHYSLTDQASKDIFVTLLDLLLESSQEDGKFQLSDVVHFISQYGTFLDGSKVVPMLPSAILLSEAVPYIQKAMQTLQFAKHNGLVALNIAKMDHMHMQDDLIQSQIVNVTLDEDKTCARCLKKIGNSVFACYSKDIMVHIFCMAK